MRAKPLAIFLVGLRHEMEMIVGMFNPKNLQEAYSLATLQEALRKGPFDDWSSREKRLFNKNQESLASLQTSKPNLPLSSTMNEGILRSSNQSYRYRTNTRRTGRYVPFRFLNGANTPSFSFAFCFAQYHHDSSISSCSTCFVCNVVLRPIPFLSYQ